jgi:hypothetical protein
LTGTVYMIISLFNLLSNKLEGCICVLYINTFIAFSKLALDVIRIFQKDLTLLGACSKLKGELVLSLCICINIICESVILISSIYMYTIRIFFTAVLFVLFIVAWAIFQLTSTCHHICLALIILSSEGCFMCDTGPRFTHSLPKNRSLRSTTGFKPAK